MRPSLVFKNAARACAYVDVGLMQYNNAWRITMIKNKFGFFLIFLTVMVFVCL